MADKILIVDDDDDLRSELVSLLEGYEVVEAGSGELALNILKKANEISLVILDVMMPGLNGLDVLAQIKKDNPRIKVIILTGHSSKDTAIEALKSRADDYIE
ncbi:MAG: response regulator, partial [Candidatus Omnitrophota bacterium]